MHAGMLATFCERTCMPDMSLLLHRVAERLRLSVQEELSDIMKIPTLRTEKYFYCIVELDAYMIPVLELLKKLLDQIIKKYLKYLKMEPIKFPKNSKLSDMSITVRSKITQLTIYIIISAENSLHICVQSTSLSGK